MLCEPVAEECHPQEAPIVKFSNSLLTELAGSFDCECSLLYLATPEGFGLVARDCGHELSDFARADIALGIRAALETSSPAAFVVRLSDQLPSRYQSVVLVSLYASMLAVLRTDDETLGVVYLDRRLTKGMFGEEHLSRLGQLLQARTPILAELMSENPDFSHLGLLSSDLREVD